MTTRRDALLKGFDDNRAFMEHTVQPNIERNRKGLMTLTVTKSDGTPAVGVPVTIKQMSHDFNFGCTLFLLEEMETEEKNRLYEEKFKKLFNYGIVPFYWSGLEPEQGKPRYAADSPKIYRRPAPDLVVDFARKNSIRLKGHCLVYYVSTPKWMPRDVTAQKNLTEKHLYEVADRYADSIRDWDVENENLCHYHFPKYELYEQPDYLDWCFTHADRAFLSGNRLFINEAAFIWQERHGDFWGTRSPYYMQIERLLDHGKRVDAVGMQFHQFIRREEELEPGKSLPYDPVKLYEVMDCYGRLGRPLHVSEITIPAYSVGQEDEQVQAELLKNLYRTWFSHKDMDAIVYWNLADGYAAYAPMGSEQGENYYHGGLVHFDLTEKPAFRVLDELINREWHTECTLVTDENGRASVCGFYGDYEAVPQAEGIQPTCLHLEKGKDNRFQFHIE